MCAMGSKLRLLSLAEQSCWCTCGHTGQVYLHSTHTRMCPPPIHTQRKKEKEQMKILVASLYIGTWGRRITVSLRPVWIM